MDSLSALKNSCLLIQVIFVVSSDFLQILPFLEKLGNRTGSEKFRSRRPTRKCLGTVHIGKVLFHKFLNVNFWTALVRTADVAVLCSKMSYHESHRWAHFSL